jgi:hypothetical protein
MKWLSTVAESENGLDPSTYTAVITAQEALATVRAERDVLAQRQQQLWGDRQGHDQLAAALANRELPQVEADLLIANRRMRDAEIRVGEARQAAYPLAKAAWEKDIQAPVVREFLDLLVQVSEVVEKLHQTDTEAKQMGVSLTVCAHPQMGKGLCGFVSRRCAVNWAMENKWF